MPNWKKVIVSGSDANLNSLNVVNGLTVTGSSNLSGSLIISGSTNLVGSTGITLFTANADTLTFTGSINISGSTVQTGSISATSFTGSLFGTASYAIQALTASFAQTASFVTHLNQNVVISGSTTITGSLGVGTTGSAVVGRIDAANDVVAFSTSDENLKKNIKPIKNAIEKIEQIGGYTFDWKKDKKNIHGFSGKDVGVIAQEIEAVLPEVVVTRENGYKAVRYEKIIPLLIEAIKEQQNKINELENLLKQSK